jgi:hypothetical protein
MVTSFQFLDAVELQCDVYHCQGLPGCLAAKSGDRGVVLTQKGSFGRVTVRLRDGSIIRVMPGLLEKTKGRT